MYEDKDTLLLLLLETFVHDFTISPHDTHSTRHLYMLTLGKDGSGECVAACNLCSLFSFYCTVSSPLIIVLNVWKRNSSKKPACLLLVLCISIYMFA